MKDYFKLLVLLFICFIPANAYAYSLSCDNSTHKVGDVFSCTISGNNLAYDKLSGTIESDDALSCKRASVSPGLEVLESSTDTYFDLSGTTSSEELVVLSCQVVSNPDDTINATVSINDFTYHVLDSGGNDSTEILRSDFIKIEHKDEDEPTDTKPRDISDPSVRPRRLVSKELNVTFSQFITEYTVEVLFETEEVTFDYELNDPTSNLRIEGDTNLQVGNNTIDIYITNADGTKEACYTFYIERLARGEEIYYPESDSTLKSMVIPGYSIGFNKDNLEYKIHLTRDVDSVNINTIPNYERATVSINNTDNLKNGDIIAVEVTSADETSKTTYKIFVTKDAPKKDYSTLIVVSLLALAFVGTIAIFIITNNRKKSDPLLSIKTNKRKINKGKNFDASVVPESTANQPVNKEEQVEQINTLNLNTGNTVAPIQTEKVVVDSFNQISSTTESINLNTNTQPSQITNPENLATSNTQVPQAPQQNIYNQVPNQNVQTNPAATDMNYQNTVLEQTSSQPNNFSTPVESAQANMSVPQYQNVYQPDNQQSQNNNQ